MKSTKNEESEELEVHALFSGQLKGKCRNCGRIGHKSFQCQNCSSHNGGNNGNTNGGNYFSYCFKPGHFRQNCFNFKKKETRYGQNQVSNNKNGNHDRENYGSQDVVFVTTSKSESFTEDIWIFDSVPSEYYCNSSKGLFNFEDIKESITVGKEGQFW
jgi:hypothetical protein